MEIKDGVVSYYDGFFKHWRTEVDHFADAIGKVIDKINCNDSQLHISFEDGTAISIFDDGQNCCESRYMSCDDKLNQFKGAALLGADLKDSEFEDCKYDVHEISFLEIITSVGSFTIANHNEHNGYYGGFSVTCMKG